jgi:hypothetical protein
VPHAVDDLRGRAGELVGPASVIDDDLGVQRAGDRGRVTVGLFGGGDNAVAHGGQRLIRDVAAGRDPAVRQAPGHLERARSERAEPDRDTMPRLRFEARLLSAVDDPVVREAGLGPHAADDVHGIVQTADLLRRGADRESEAAELIVISPGAQAKDKPTAGQPVQRLGGLGDQRRRAERNAQNAGHHCDPAGGGGDPGKQRPGLVRRMGASRMVRGGDEVEAQVLGGSRIGDRIGAVRGGGGDVDPEQQVQGVN